MSISRVLACSLVLAVPLAAACGARSYPSAGGDAVTHNLEALNAFRAQAGAPPLQLSDALSRFATDGSNDLANGGEPHAHFGSVNVFAHGFCNGAGENQAPGWSRDGGDDATIDRILQAMMNEGPGGGHHDNIVNPDYALVGIGLVVKDNGLYFTNDFSNACN